MKHATRRGILVPLYFFVGGLAGGLYLLGALEQLLFRQPENGWPLAWLGFRVALPLEVLGAAILTVR